MSSLLESIPDKISPILGQIKIYDVNEINHYITSTDTSFTVKIGYVVDSNVVENTIFKYRINGGVFTPDSSSYIGYQSEHTFTGLTLNEGDIIEAIVTVKLEGNRYINHPRIPVIITVLQRESLSDIKLMRRDVHTMIKNIGFYLHHISFNPDILDCPCIDIEFGRPNAYCEDCDGLGLVGGYDLAETIKGVLQEEVPYALHGDAVIFTRIGTGGRADAIIFIKHDVEMKEGDFLFYRGYRWKVINFVTIPYVGATIYSACEMTREFGLQDVTW